MRYDGFYLLDHHRNRHKSPGPAGEFNTRPWYESRLPCQHGHTQPHLIVIHDPETIADFDPPYSEAERVAAYGQTTTRASWHDTIDADSIIPMLPPEFTAWHVRGFNRCGIGLEVGAMSTTWDKAPAEWLEGVMANTATRVREHMDAFDIPATLLFEPGKRYAEPLNPSGFGLISHHALDPDRRTDPGFTFPWNDLLQRLETDMPEPKVTMPSWADSSVRHLADRGYFPNGTPSTETIDMWRTYVFLARADQSIWNRIVAWTKDHVKGAIAAAAAAGWGAGQIDYGELVAEIGRALSGG